MIQLRHGDAEGWSGFARIHLGIDEPDTDEQAAGLQKGVNSLLILRAPLRREGAEAGVLKHIIK
jgi:hypothetical protein